jgi:hypothetical protein
MSAERAIGGEMQMADSEWRMAKPDSLRKSEINRVTAKSRIERLR